MLPIFWRNILQKASSALEDVADNYLYIMWLIKNARPRGRFGAILFR
jgi:hypothetical protein